jgi:sphingomyelin phosphodiesterase
MMSKTFLSILFFISILSTTKTDNTDISNILEKIASDIFSQSFLAENAYVVQSLMELINNRNSMTCTTCSFLVDVIKNFLLQKVGFDKFYQIIKNICHITVFPAEVCDGAVDLYADLVVDSFFKRFLDGDWICSLIKICQDTKEYESIEEFAERILKDKPESIEREVVKRKNDEDYYKVVQITDIHLDMEYKEGTVANCVKPLCCRELKDDDLIPVKQTFAGFYGTIGKCDANMEAVRAMAAKVKELNPDYILFTGDNVGHSVWNIVQSDIIKATQMEIEALQNELGLDIPILPSIGNHEKAPADEFHGKEAELLHGMADIFKPYLDKEAYETFRNYGYYTVLIKEKLRIISLNCLLCDSFNLHLLYDSSQPNKMFKWLEQVLNSAERSGEIVHIVDHVPMHNSENTIQCASRLKILMDRYQNTVRGFFSGHTHREYLSIVHEYYNETKPIHINFVGSGMTTFREYQQSFRMYLIDKKEKYIQDYTQFRMNLTESNEQKKPIWFIPYNATEFFGVTSMNDVENMAKYRVTPDYVKHKYTDVPQAEERAKQESEIKLAQCQYDYDYLMGVLNCNGYSVFSEDYLYYLLNKLHVKWTK